MPQQIVAMFFSLPSLTELSKVILQINDLGAVYLQYKPKAQ